RPGEYTLLLLLAEHAGETLSVDRIAREFGMGDEERRAERIKWHVWKLRQSIESDPKHPKIIVTEAGSGYRLELR
ncbi:MAG TPA: helix-turn-helix domain-containing protein, partial [Anaerolineae bacterium]